MIKRRTTIVITLITIILAACSKQKAENPFSYPFIKELHINREPGKPYSDYKAFYVLTEDFEPRVETASDVESIRSVLQYALQLTSQYKIPWTHFVEVNSLAPAFISDDQQLKQACLALIADLKLMVGNGDDCELHLHGPLKGELLDFWRSQEKLRVRPSGAKSLQEYRQRKSFFFNSFYAGGYRELVVSLRYGKLVLEQSIYDGKEQVVAFRPGGWDHGSSSQDTFLYFNALRESGLSANSGLATGAFGTTDWSVGNYPGHNVAAVSVGEDSIIEVSPTTGPGGYVNPVLPNNLEKLAGSASGEMPVIISVYHLGGLQKVDYRDDPQDEPPQSSEDIQKQRDALERHFRTVGDLVSRKILYPIKLRDLLAIISERQ